jgi:hypothetical protein
MTAKGAKEQSEPRNTRRNTEKEITRLFRENGSCPFHRVEPAPYRHFFLQKSNFNGLNQKGLHNSIIAQARAFNAAPSIHRVRHWGQPF